MQQNISSQCKISIQKKLILIICGLLISVIFLEIGLRLGGSIFSFLQEYRNKASIYKKGTYHIVCLGESTTAIGGRDFYPSQLEEILNARNIGIKFSVINKGICATNTTYILSQLESNLNQYKPDMVTAMMGLNDPYIKYYEDVPEANTALFKNLKTYKFLRLLCMHIVNKAKERKIVGPKGIKKLATLYPAVNDTGRSVKQKNYIQNEEDKFKKAIELNPKNDNAYVRLGWYYISQGAIANTEESFKKAIEFNPEEAEAYIGLGQMYKDSGQYVQAEEMFKKILELNPRDDNVYVKLGRVYLEKRDFQSEELSFKKALELNPKNDQAYFGLGGIYRNQRKYADAEEMFKKGLELNPRDDMAYIQLVQVYIDQNRYSQAEGIFKKAIEQNPGNDLAYRGLIALYEAMDRDREAKEYYKLFAKMKLESCSPITIHNYRKLKEILDKRRIKLVCIQYPVRRVESLKKIFEEQAGVIFVDNEKIFKDALDKTNYKEYFADMFGGDYGHCTPKGNRLLAENIANVILKEYLAQ